MSFSAYVDGFNLYKGLLESRPELKWLDLKELSESFYPEEKCQDVFYFTAYLKRKFPQDKSNERQHSYLRALSGSGVEVIPGKFEVRSIWKPINNPDISDFTQPKFPNLLGYSQWSLSRIWRAHTSNSPLVKITQYREKGSDVNLASFLLRDVYLRKVKKILVITGDSDLFTPVKMAEDYGVEVKILVPTTRRNNIFNKFSNSLSDVSILSPDYLKDYQFQNPFFTKDGRQIKKPAEWL